MNKPTCHTCVFAYWDKGLWLRSLGLGMPLGPLCANHPDAPGHERETPSGRICGNYRPRPKTPDLSDGTVKRIPITGGLYAYVDAVDYEQISRHHWRLVGGGYAGRYENHRCILMHRQIMNPPEGMVVDHLSGNRMDNTRVNLHVCTPAENCRNRPKRRGSSSNYFGVYWVKPRNKWMAVICLGGRHNRTIGYFDDEAEAARAYDHAAVMHFGDAARLNFPEEWPPQRRRRVHAQARKAESSSARASTAAQKLKGRKPAKPTGKKRT
jgi:hypothetical protein